MNDVLMAVIECSIGIEQYILIGILLGRTVQTVPIADIGPTEGTYVDIYVGAMLQYKHVQLQENGAGIMFVHKFLKFLVGNAMVDLLEKFPDIRVCPSIVFQIGLHMAYKESGTPEKLTAFTEQAGEIYTGLFRKAFHAEEISFALLTCLNIAVSGIRPSGFYTYGYQSTGGIGEVQTRRDLSAKILFIDNQLVGRCH